MDQIEEPKEVNRTEVTTKSYDSEGKLLSKTVVVTTQFETQKTVQLPTGMYL